MKKKIVIKNKLIENGRKEKTKISTVDCFIIDAQIKN